MARGRYNEQEPGLYEDQFGDFYYDPNTGEFFSAPATSGIGAPEVAYYDPAPVQTYYDPAPVYYPPARESEETYYDPTPVYYEPPPPPPAPAPAPEPVYYAPVPESAPTYYEPEPVYYAPQPEIVSGIGSPAAISYEPEQTYTQATVAQSAEPAPVSGIGNSAPPPFVPQYREPDPEPVYYEAPPAPQPAPAAEQPAFRDDDYTGRMGSDGEPERYSTMRGGDPRIQQQRELEIQQERLQAPIAIRSWMTTNTKDVRGEKPAESITLQPGKQYQIVDFTGKNNGEVIASGSTPEEFLRMQDIAEGLNAQGRRADWRLQEVSDEPSESKFGSALEPTTGKYITTLGGDLYNKSGWSTVADIAKIAVPIALQFIPGLGTALGTSILGAKAGATGATLGAKILGAGLTSAIGRTGTGIVTGENIGDALKAGAISGLASGATAGVLGGLSAPTPGETLIPAGALSGAPMSVIPARVISSAIPASAFSGIGDLAAGVLPEIVVSAARNTIAPTVLGGLTAASGSLLGDVGTSLLQPDRFQQAVDQARAEAPPSSAPVEADEILALGRRAVPTIPGTEVLAGVSAAAPEGVRYIVDPSAVTGQTADTRIAETPAEEEIIVSTPGTPANVAGLANLPASVISTLVSQPSILDEVQPPPKEAQTEEPMTTVTGTRVSTALVPTALTSATPSLIEAFTSPPPATTQTTEGLYTGDDPMIDVDAKRIPTTTIVPAAIGATIPALTSSLTPAEPATTTKDKDFSVSDAVRTAGLVSTAAGLVEDALGGGGGGGTINPGTGYTVPTGRRILNRFDDDPFTYGQKSGELLFFGDGMAEGGEVDDDMVKHLIEYRKGGGHMGPGQVKGIGSGQDDKIPAWLSDGEYVWSAQDVADLGDGSTDEGVRRLDKMRQMVRKGAGRKDVKKIAKPQRGIEDMLKAVGGAV
jgi:hypothetical protein